MNTSKESNFKNLPQLLDYFKDEATCKSYLEQQRWGGHVTCPHCGHEKVYRTNRGFKCASKDCYKKFTVTVGTIFENTKISLRLWFAAIYLCTAHKKGVSSCQIARDLGVHQSSAWFILHRVREMLRTKAPQMLSGIVEADETYIGSKAKNWTKQKREAIRKLQLGTGYVHKRPVIGFLQRGGEVKTVVMPSAKVNGKSVKPLVYANVKAGSILMTDQQGGYFGLNKTYQHEVLVKDRGEYVRGDFHTNSIEGFWSHLKRSIIGVYHQVSVKHLSRYCDEISYRYNSRESKDTERFEFVLTHSEGRLKYTELTAH